MATPSKNRWELEEKRKKQALAAAQQAIKSGAAFKGNAVTDTVKKTATASTAKKTTTTPKASTVTVSKPQGANIPAFLQGSGRTTAEKVSTPKQQNGFSSLQTLAEMPKTVQSIGNSVLQTSNDMRNLQRNSLLWHGTTDANERARLKSENDAIRQRLGLSYDNGSTYNPRTGQNLSQMTDMLYGSSAATRANTATQYAANQLPQILSQQASVRSQKDEEKGIAERVMETIEASTKRVRAGLDNWFATGNIAADEEAEQKFLAGEELGWLDQLRMKERWGENWESYLSGVRDAYQTGNTAIIEDYEQRARALNNLYDTTSLFDEAAQQAEAAKAGLSTAGKTALDALGMGANMLGAASIASTGGGGAGLFTGVSSVSAAGQAADQARRMGANAAQQEDYGNAVGALNFAVERLGGIGGGQAAAKIANRMLPEAVKNAAGKVTSTAVGRVLAGGAEEGLEGALQSEGERALRNVILDANERFDPAKFGVDIGYNALMGSLFRGGQEVAGTVLGGMRQGQTGNAAAQQAQQTNDTTTVSSSGFLLLEAKRQRMAAQDAAYAAQIDDVFRGNMPTDRAVSIGDTPDILLSIGATDLPMTMKQSTARKIAFPAGYMGGAHNLGVPALKRLPEQLRDPAAVLRSKTQPDSFVVLTEWNDTNGNPVIIALHLDKQGVVDVTNEVASAYGKNNFAALTGENGENVLYTKNNKSIDQILDDRLQLPALLSDDTLVAYSIAQQAEKSNAEQEIQALGRRLAELDAQKRQAEGLLPGPIRDRAIAEAEQAMQEVQQQATQTGAQQTTSDPGAQVPASEAMQYGKPPELAMMEARERARNAAAQEQRLAEQADREASRTDAFDRIIYDKPQEIANTVSEAMNLAERVAARHRLQRATVRATPSSADKYIDATAENATVELVNGLESERFFLRNLRNAWHLTDAELVNAREIAAGRGPVSPMTEHREELVETYARALRNYNSNMEPAYEYLDNTKRGMKQQEALKEADRWTAGLMGDRSKGARPVLFEERNPISKAFSMFQLEVMNQYDYLFGDIPSNARAQGKGKLAVVATTASALLQIFLLSHIYNDAREKTTGTRGAFDPIEIVNDFVGRLTGYAMPNVFTLISEAVNGDLTAEDFMVQQSESGWENAQATMQDVASNVPFLSGPIGGLFGASNARLPIETVVPNFSSIFSKSGVAQREAAIKELTKPVYGILLPFGGTQIKKTVEGIATELAGGSYVHDNDGNLKLQFPAYGQSPLEWARSAIFGKWSGEEAQKYIDSGFKGLSADETRIYNGLRDDFGVEPNKAMDAVLSLRGFKSLENDEGKTIQTVKEQQRRALFDNAELTPEQKQWVDQELLVDPDSDQTPADYTGYTSFVLSMYDSESRREAAEQAVQHGLTVDQFVQWDDRLKAVSSMKDRFDKNRYSDAEARSMVLDEVLGDSTLSDSEKQAIADYVLISSMDSDTQKELWETVAKGKVNASDFLRFKSDISAYEEDAKGTGTNNMENVATILRGYDELTDEQRDILFQTYNKTMSNNPFHVSVYEQAISENSLYQSLTDEGKAALRALTNEYEQHVNEGRELDEWRAKAYMAEKEAGIAPGIYALYRTVLQSVDAQNDDNNYLSQDEAEIAINTIPGLTQYQKAYIWQSMSPKWKKNPFGSATVSEYQSGVQEAINPVPTGWAGGDQSGFGPREAPIAGASTWHKALDIPANGGDPVVSIMDGKVTFSCWVDGYGWTVHIDHGNGLETEYHHMQEQSSLKPGDTVAQGDQVGAVGSTGRSQGNHLDFQVWKDGQYVDPLTVIPGYGKGPSGYVYEGSSASGAISSGVAAAQSGASGSSGSSGLKNLKTIKQGLGGLDNLF